MKKIDVKILISREKKLKLKYYIFFGKDETLHFSSKRKAQDFIVSLEKTLNHTVISLSELNTQLYSIYMHNYININGVMCYKIKEDFNYFLEALNRVYNKIDKGNASNFNAIKSMFNIIEEIIINLKAWAKKNNHHNINHRFNSILKTKELLVNSFYNDINSHKINFSYTEKKLKIVYMKSINKIS